MDPSTPDSAIASVKPMSSHLVGGRYELLGKIAAGGMGTVYKARHAVTRQVVALKLLDRSLARDDTHLERFMREARVGALIGHDGVCKVYDAGVDDDPVHGRRPFVAMEHLFGLDLAGYLGRGHVRAAEGVEIVMRVLEPLAAAHGLGIVHRDLKPENIFVELDADGHMTRVRLLDFGVAHIPDADLSLTADGATLGTVYYMPPEQCLDARSVTPATDVYALAVILYQILGGVFPFDGDSAHAILIRAGSIEPVPLRHYAHDIDPRLEALIDKSLSKNPVLRPQSAGALRDALRPLCDADPVRAWLASRRVDPSTFSDDPGDDPFARRSPAGAPVTPSPTTTVEAPIAPPSRPPSALAPVPVPAPAPRPFVPTSPARPLALTAAALVGLVACLGAWSLLRHHGSAPTAAVAWHAPPSAALPPAPAQPPALLRAPTPTLAQAPASPAMPSPSAPLRGTAALTALDTARPTVRRLRRESPMPMASTAPTALAEPPPAPVAPAPVVEPEPARAAPPSPAHVAPAPIVDPEPALPAVPRPIVAPTSTIARPPAVTQPAAPPAHPTTPPPAPDFVTF